MVECMCVSLIALLFVEAPSELFEVMQGFDEPFSNHAEYDVGHSVVKEQRAFSCWYFL